MKKNLINLKKINNYEIIEDDVFNKNTFFKINYRFDIIFLDPPYKIKNLDSIFEYIVTNKICNNNGIIILHRHKDEKDIFSKKFKVIEEKKYGISKIIFLSFSN